MLANFENQLKELLHAAPCQPVDIHPLVHGYVKDKTIPQNLLIRKKMAALIADLEKQNLVITDAEAHFFLINQSPLKLDALPIFIQSTPKFEAHYIAANERSKANPASTKYIETGNRIAAFKKIMPSLFSKSSSDKEKV